MCEDLADGRTWFRQADRQKREESRILPAFFSVLSFCVFVFTRNINAPPSGVMSYRTLKTSFVSAVAARERRRDLPPLLLVVLVLAVVVVILAT